MKESPTEPEAQFVPSPTETASINLVGDTLSGSGQLVRLAIGLSALTRTSIVIDKIRAGRPKGGLKQQHLTALQFLRDATGPRVCGAVKGSRKVGMFYPAKVWSYSTSWHSLLFL
jgi:RNA 3'-terminal phosphate cyclase (ATP)